MSTTTLLTFAEFENMPEKPGKQELIAGEVIEMPPPDISHTLTTEAVVDLLRGVLGKARVHMEAGFLLAGTNWVQPDAAVLWPDQPRTRKYWTGSPMAAIEVLSEHKSAQYVQDKLELYFNHGAREVWVVSRKRMSITVYRRGEDGATSGTRVTDEYTPEWLGVAVKPAELITP
ncbi:MAG TPA: Uma2 family endonuclease [Bryobacteraceae bacterium]|nr:Uma2 family endonuclease [Bryobacteraceae bacterium]